MLLLSSCSIKPYLQQDQYLLNKNILEIERPYRKDTEKGLEQLYKQNPNNKLLLFFKTKPYYYFKGSQGKDNWYKRFKRNVLGEPAVFVDTVFVESTCKAMRAYMKSIGYFYPEITYKVDKTSKKRANVIYHVKQNEQYKIGAYQLQIADRQVYDIVKKDLSESTIRIGNGLHATTLDNEISRVVTLLRNNGYYMMSKDYVDFDIDTTNRNYYAFVGLNIRNPENGEAHKKYFNHNMTIEIEQNAGIAYSGHRDTITTKTFKYIPGKYELNPMILDRNILLFPGNEFKQSSLSRTYTRISDLGIFRFVNVQPSTEEIRDSGFVNYHMKVIPMVKYDYSIEPQATTSDQNSTLTNQGGRNFGVAVELKVRDRNVFHGAEVLQFTFRSAFEAQKGQSNTSTRFFNSTEQRLTASIIIPRSVFLRGLDKDERFLSTKTAFNMSAIYEVNLDYRRQIFTANMSSQFNKKLISYTLVPLELSYIKSDIISDELQKQSETDIFLQNLFSNNIILDTRFGFVYTDKPIAKGIHYVYLRWDAIELAGNLLNQIKKLTNAAKDENGEYTIFGVRYYQYAKSAIDFRYNTVYDKNNAVVYRFYSGVAVPYGNTKNFAPFDKRFFVGGANDLRGWLPRSIGPGSYTDTAQLDFSGEIKLEANAEFRFNIYHRWLEGGVFADAGNIWAIKKDPTHPNADFQWDRFYKEIAFDAGIGVRLNFEIFILRFDFAIPLHDPSYPISERWVVNDFNSKWLSKNFLFNFGIGYPF